MSTISYKDRCLVLLARTARSSQYTNGHAERTTNDVVKHPTISGGNHAREEGDFVNMLPHKPSGPKATDMASAKM